MNGTASATVSATVRGVDVPLHDAHGHVVVSTSAASYVLLGGTLVALRDSQRARPRTRTTSSVLAPTDPAAWRPGTPVRLEHGVLLGSGAPVSVLRASVWQPPAAPASVDLRAAPARLVRLLGAPHRQHDLAPHIERLVDAVRSDVTTGIEQALRSLIGRGPGLTPSGDDIVTGMLAVAHRTADERLVARLAPRVAALAHRTTVVGAHQLTAACRGAVAEPAVDLVDALVIAHRAGSDDGAALGRAAYALRTLLDVGATTGADTLAGIAAGVELVAHERSPLRSTTAVPA